MSLFLSLFFLFVCLYVCLYACMYVLSLSHSSLLSCLFPSPFSQQYITIQYSFLFSPFISIPLQLFSYISFLDSTFYTLAFSLLSSFPTFHFHCVYECMYVCIYVCSMCVCSPGHTVTLPSPSTFPPFVYQPVLAPITRRFTSCVLCVNTWTATPETTNARCRVCPAGHITITSTSITTTTTVHCPLRRPVSTHSPRNGGRHGKLGYRWQYVGGGWLECHARLCVSPPVPRRDGETLALWKGEWGEK